jgi:hypothetical protein
MPQSQFGRRRWGTLKPAVEKLREHAEEHADEERTGEDEVVRFALGSYRWGKRKVEQPIEKDDECNDGGQFESKSPPAAGASRR